MSVGASTPPPPERGKPGKDCVRFRAVLSFFKRLFRAVRFAATDKRIPRPLRWLVGLGVLPVPGPFDEIVLLVAAVPLGLLYREPLAEAWRRAGEGV
jgi:hypothetical protein